MRRMGWGVQIVGLSLLLGACGEFPEPETIRSGSGRILDPQVSSADFELQVRANTDFGFDVWKKLRTQHQNIVYSPHSVSSALAMLYAGARTETEAEMAESLRFELGQGVHPAMNRLDLELRAAVERVDSTSRLDLRVVNDVWLQKGFTVQTDYLDTMESHYGAGVRSVDFVGDSLGAREIINGWVAARTEDRVRELFPADAIHTETRMVLTNAIYFKARWLKEFDQSDTKTGTFRNADGQTVSVPFMRRELSLLVARGAELTAVELPYAGEDFALLVLMPSAATRESFEAGLDAGELERVVGSLQKGKVHLELPRFELELPLRLDPVLQELGLKRVYGAGGPADLTGIHDGPDRLQLDTVVHHAFILVDEEGTEAVAATGASTRIISATPVLRFDRPFTFFLRHRPSGAVLFMGRVAQLPGSGSN